MLAQVRLVGNTFELQPHRRDFQLICKGRNNAELLFIRTKHEIGRFYFKNTNELAVGCFDDAMFNLLDRENVLHKSSFPGFLAAAFALFLFAELTLVIIVSHPPIV